ncbi:MAG: cell division septation protein DedD, partial [Planctomycetota bacterium]
GEKSAKYFVVVGSYAKNENANIKINSLAKEGVNAYIMTEVNSDILRICVAESETFEGILNHLNTIRNSFEPDAWIIRNE